MARIAFGLLALALVLGASGCTWTQTYRDYPPRLNGVPLMMMSTTIIMTACP